MNAYCVCAPPSPPPSPYAAATIATALPSDAVGAAFNSPTLTFTESTAAVAAVVAATALAAVIAPASLATAVPAAATAIAAASDSVPTAAASITPPARTDDGCARDGRASHTHPPRIAPLISASCTRPVARSVPTGDAATIKDIAAVTCATRDT